MRVARKERKRKEDEKREKGKEEKSLEGKMMVIERGIEMRERVQRKRRNLIIKGVKKE